MKKLFKKKKIGLDNSDYRVVVSVNPSSSASEAYRRIKVALEFISMDSTNKVVQICSSISGEGKTTTALNIAAAFAEAQKKAIVVDLDLRKPRCHRAFKIENQDGIYDVLENKVPLEQAIKHNKKLGFDLLNTGKRRTNIFVTLQSQLLKNIIDKLREMYEIIIVDCPPVLAFSDSIVISTFCDSAIFVTSQHRADKKAAKDAVKFLKTNNVNLIGCVFTEVTNEKTLGGQYYNYYYNQSNQ